MIGSLFALVLTAQQELPRESVEFFEKKIRPVFVDRCYKCHSLQAGKAKGGLHLDTRDALLKGGDSGPAIVPGQPDKSLLIKAVRHSDDTLQMPEKEKLPDEQIADLVAWIKLGAPDPRISTNVAAAPSPTINLAAARKFWSFQPPIDRDLPEIKQGARTAVDRFILSRLESKGLAFAPEADKRTLLRRITYDLTGLPPTEEEIYSFLVDDSPQAYERVVERLLASARYGERWGRHWLDVVRYADTKEWVVDEERRLPYPFTYRDWVIRAFNDDLPYDKFLVYQLAADRVEKADPQHLAALGFLTVGRSFLNRQPDIIDDKIDVVSRGFLGLSVSCARCHDHKYDPVPTRDYYSLYGIFASAGPPKEMPLLGAPVMSPPYAEYLKELAIREGEITKLREKRHADVVLGLKAADKIADYLVAVHEGVQEEEARRKQLNAEALKRWTAYLKSNPPAFAFWRACATKPPAELWTQLIGAPPAIAAAFAEPHGSVREGAEKFARALLDESFKDLLASPEFPANLPVEKVDPFLTGDDRTKLRQLRRKVEELHHHPGSPPRAMTVEDTPAPHNPRVFIRGNPGSPGEEVPRQFLAILSPDDRGAYKDGGRLELAKAIATPGNPLTPRVWVNRVWLQHFGFGIVRTPSDFGVRGDAPTHPELLDWLALRFVQSGWSTKALHRLIVLSNAYRQSSRDHAGAQKIDPLNTLLWKQNRRRLDLESMRDSMLSVSGALDLAMGGRSVDITKEPFATRRTVYGYIDRLNLAHLFKTFDFPMSDMHLPQRYSTTIPQQALWLMNNPFVMEQAARVAGRDDVTRHEDPAERVRRIYRVVFGRDATDREVALGTAFVGSAGSAAPVVQTPVWQYGTGTGGADFHPLPQFTTQGWQGGPKLPDPKLGGCLLTAAGGHAGGDAAHGVIRRWTAQQAGTIAIAGALSHKEKAGDGVRGRIVSSRAGELASWSVARMEAETKLSGLEVAEGETIDFVIDCRADNNSDAFAWAPSIKMGDHEWNALSGFDGPPPKPPPPMSVWEKYVHVLLESNEFLFVD